MKLQDPQQPPSRLPLPRFRVAWGSLKLRITLAVIGALGLGIGLTSFVLVSRVERSTLATERDHELNESVRTASLLSRRVVEFQRALASVAPQLDAATLASESALYRFTKNHSLLRNLFSMVYVADLQGRGLMYANDQGIGPRLDASVADRDYFQRTLAEGRAQISNVVRNKLSGEPIIIFTQPVIENGRVSAVLAGVLRLSSRDLLDGLAEGDEQDSLAGPTSVTMIVTDANGLILAHPDRNRVMGSLVNEPRLSAAFNTWKAIGSPIEPQGLTIAQSGELISLSGVPAADWLIWRVRSEEALLAPLHAARFDAMRLAIALVVLFSLGMLLLMHWLLRPLVQLQHRALHLFDGTVAPQDGWPLAGGEIGSLSCVLRRVGTERVQLELRNAEVLGQLRSVMSAAPAGIAIVREGRFELVGAAFRRLLGFEAEASASGGDDPLIRQPAPHIFLSALDYPLFAALELQAFAQRHPYRGEWQLRRHDGTAFWARVHSKPVDADDLLHGEIWIVDDIDEARAAHEHLKWTAMHDPLTGLANRRVFMQRAEEVIAAWPDVKPAAIVFIDLDHFKPVNDLAGHNTGDLMLLAVAKAMKSRVRSSDLVARMGGDEFALLLEGCSHDAALRIARDVRNGIAEIAMPWDKGLLTVGASLGVASLAAHISDTTQWLEAADAACYEAKNGGRGAVCSADDHGTRTHGPSDAS